MLEVDDDEVDVEGVGGASDRYHADGADLPPLLEAWLFTPADEVEEAASSETAASETALPSETLNELKGVA